MQFTIPETGFVRLKEILAIIPVKKSCWWDGVKSGRFPKPVKLSERCTGWRAEDIRALIKRISDEVAAKENRIAESKSHGNDRSDSSSTTPRLL